MKLCIFLFFLYFYTPLNLILIQQEKKYVINELLAPCFVTLTSSYQIRLYKLIRKRHILLCISYSMANATVHVEEPIKTRWQNHFQNIFAKSTNNKTCLRPLQQYILRNPI